MAFTMAQPARHRERSRKTLPAGDPKFGLTAQAGKLYLPVIQSSASLHNCRGFNRRWMKVQWRIITRKPRQCSDTQKDCGEVLCRDRRWTFPGTSVPAGASRREVIASWLRSPASCALYASLNRRSPKRRCWALTSGELARARLDARALTTFNLRRDESWGSCRP